MRQRHLGVSRDAGWNARHVIAKEGTRDIASKIEASPDRALVYILFGRYAQWGYYAADWEHPDTVKYRVDTAFDCLRNAQLGYISGRDARTAKCSGLDFPPTPGRKPEIVGNCPPGPQAGAMADDQWAAEEAARIEAAKSPSIWLFLPDAASHFINGFPMRRKLLEKLESKLEASGCRKVERDWEGETQVDKFECGDRTVSLKAREGRKRPERIGPRRLRAHKENCAHVNTRAIKSI